MGSNGDRRLERSGQIGRIFTPSAPVTHRDLFAGRITQLMQVLSALGQQGLQIVIYGERGVGKSSLANVLSQYVTYGEEPHLRAVRVNCSTSDTFKSIWQNVLLNAGLPIPEGWAYSTPDPEEIRRILASFPSPFVILDEFDRWEDDEGLSAMADTIKALSDHSVTTKIVIVGVADSIDELIGEHESVRRAIEEVQLPRMSREELLEIPTAGFAQMEMSITPEAANAIANLAEGLPHFAHLLSLHAGRRCIADDNDHVRLADVEGAIQEAVRRHSILRMYQTAVAAQRRDTLHPKVLLACALAEKDALGFFTTSAVRATMAEITGKRYQIPTFAPHLAQFADPDHGAVLRREGTERKYRYRFRDPLLQPFTIMTALAEGWLPGKYRDQLYGSDLPT